VINDQFMEVEQYTIDKEILMGGSDIYYDLVMAI
jgi:hypothetical protein